MLKVVLMVAVIVTCGVRIVVIMCFGMCRIVTIELTKLGSLNRNVF